jgi:hypothetical protein
LRTPSIVEANSEIAAASSDAAPAQDPPRLAQRPVAVLGLGQVVERAEQQDGVDAALLEQLLRAHALEAAPRGEALGFVAERVVAGDLQLHGRHSDGPSSCARVTRSPPRGAR